MSPLFRVRDALRARPLSLAELCVVTGLDADSAALALAHWRRRKSVRRIFALGPSTNPASSCASRCTACSGRAGNDASAQAPAPARFVWVDRNQT